MKIDPTKVAGLSQARRSDKSKKTGSTEFSRLLDGAGESTATRQTGNVTGVDQVFAAQELGDREGGGQQARERAELMLEKLEDIRVGLLVGAIPSGKLQQLAEAVRQKREEFNDPRLAEIIDDIELRARVELAKLEKKP